MIESVMTTNLHQLKIAQLQPKKQTNSIDQTSWVLTTLVSTLMQTLKNSRKNFPQFYPHNFLALVMWWA